MPRLDGDKLSAAVPPRVLTEDDAAKNHGVALHSEIWGPAFCMWNSFKFRNELGIRDPWESQHFSRNIYYLFCFCGCPPEFFRDFIDF